MSVKLLLKNVRISYPALFKPRAYAKGKDSTPKYGVTCLLHPKKNKADIEAIEEAMDELIDAAFKGKKPKGMRPVLKDGNDKTDDDDNVADGYEDMMYIKASSKKKVPVVDRDLEDISEDDDKLAGGDYANVSIRLYAQDNDYGRHINVQLTAVQFVKEGERFGDSAVDVQKEFKKLKDEDDEPRKKRRRDDDDDDEDERPRKKRRRDDDEDIL